MNSEAPVFKIKTGHLPVLLLHVLTADFELLKEQLALRLSQVPDFFSSTPIVLELAAIAGFDDELDFPGLVEFMRKHGMCAAGVNGGSESQRAAAAQVGLGLYPDTPVRNMMRRATDRVPVSDDGTLKLEAFKLNIQPELPGMVPVEAAPSTAPASVQVAPAAPQMRPTMVVDKPVRTGQSIYAEGANLVLLAIANAGSELIADGDIHVYAPLRGKAIAGARGNESARIFVNRMEAELISIAGCFKVFEDGVPEDVRGKPAQIHLEGNRLVMQPMSD